MNLIKSSGWPLLGLGLSAVLFLSGCGGAGHSSHAHDATLHASSHSPSASKASFPIVPSNGSIVITADDMMRFDPAGFTVEAGSEVTVVLRNIGRIPKQAMGHNLVLLAKGVNALAFSQAAMRHPNEDYIPPEYASRVLAATAVLGPGEEEALTFIVPEEPGDYPFVCSFPGHTPAGMRGVMKVVKDTEGAGEYLSQNFDDGKPGIQPEG